MLDVSRIRKGGKNSSDTTLIFGEIFLTPNFFGVAILPRILNLLSGNMRIVIAGKMEDLPFFVAKQNFPPRLVFQILEPVIPSRSRYKIRWSFLRHQVRSDDFGPDPVFVIGRFFQSSSVRLRPSETIRLI